MTMKPRTCDVISCPLQGSKPVWGTGSSSSICTLIGEAPGGDEEAYGAPFVGRSGQELTMYLKQFTRVIREHFYITNLVKCQPPKNRDPYAKEIEYCVENYLKPELIDTDSAIIGVVGRVSTQWFLGKTTMEKVHGIPFHWEGLLMESIVVPLYHPAYGLHSPRQMKDVIEDFTALGRVIRGQLKPRSDNALKLDYRLEQG